MAKVIDKHKYSSESSTNHDNKDTILLSKLQARLRHLEYERIHGTDGHNESDMSVLSEQTNRMSPIELCTFDEKSLSAPFSVMEINRC